MKLFKHKALLFDCIRQGVCGAVAGLSSRGARQGDACARKGMCDLPLIHFLLIIQLYGYCAAFPWLFFKGSTRQLVSG